MMRTRLVDRLPVFPWDQLEPAKQRAHAHPEGIVDLSVGTPVDPTPETVQQALAAATNAPGYPATTGTAQLQAAIVQFLQRHRGAPNNLSPGAVLPTIGSKELVASLPSQLGLGAGALVAYPHIAYPTYEIGARLAGAESLPVDVAALARHADSAGSAQSMSQGTDARVDQASLLWINSPSNPTGAVLTLQELRSLVQWARARGVVVASDECYALLPGELAEVPSILDPRVNDGDLTDLLCVYSLSKQSNLAGYRAAFVAGDENLIQQLLLVRKHAGLIMPAPVQAAMTRALSDDQSSLLQRERYAQRRALLQPAIEAAGGTITHSLAGLYLWATFGEDCMRTVDRLAEHGILVAPGMFYGESAGEHVRISLTATDVHIAAAVARLAHLSTA